MGELKLFTSLDLEKSESFKTDELEKIWGIKRGIISAYLSRYKAKYPERVVEKDGRYGIRNTINFKYLVDFYETLPDKHKKYNLEKVKKDHEKIEIESKISELRNITKTQSVKIRELNKRIESLEENKGFFVKLLNFLGGK